jgi:serine/threonine-protein kinase
MILPNGTMLGRYRIEGELGQGQAGVVYRALDTAIERIVAIKCLRTETPSLEPERANAGLGVHFEEAKVIGHLNHPHITAVFDMGNAGNVPYIVMEYVQGETLKARLTQTQTDPASVPQILSFIVMVARALHYVHQRGILHGDIKPANLFVTPQGTPKIMDFGVARRSQASRPASWSLAGVKHVWGTPGYVAPEQLVANEIDARADVFSLGVVAYEWLAGRRPFQGDTDEAILKAMLRGRPTSLSELGDFDSELATAIELALSSDPTKRFDSADAMADGLEICLERWFKQSPKRNQPDSANGDQVISFPRLKSRNILFADFSEADLANVMQMSRRETYQAGDTILQEGAGGSTMYLLVRGRVSVRKASGAQQVEIKQISSGECFGEMAVISHLPRSATVVAVQRTEVIAISGVVLRSANQVLCLKLYRNIAALLADRVRQRDEQVVALRGGETEKRPPKRLFPFW